MNTFCDTIRKLRKEKKLPLRTVAAFLEIDQAIPSKIERGQRKASRDLVLKIASYYKTDKNDLMVSYSEKASGTLLDYADIKYKLEKLLGRSIDLVEEGYVKSFAKNQLIAINY